MTRSDSEVFYYKNCSCEINVTKPNKMVMRHRTLPFDMRRLVRVFAEQNKTSNMIVIVQYNNLFSVMTMLSKMSLHKQMIRWHK